MPDVRSCPAQERAIPCPVVEFEMSLFDVQSLSIRASSTRFLPGIPFSVAHFRGPVSFWLWFALGELGRHWSASWFNPVLLFQNGFSPYLLR
jgi:hypothetical protein